MTHINDDGEEDPATEERIVKEASMNTRFDKVITAITYYKSCAKVQLKL